MKKRKKIATHDTESKPKGHTREFVMAADDFGRLRPLRSVIKGGEPEVDEDDLDLASS